MSFNTYQNKNPQCSGMLLCVPVPEEEVTLPQTGLLFNEGLASLCNQHQEKQGRVREMSVTG